MKLAGPSIFTLLLCVIFTSVCFSQTKMTTSKRLKITKIDSDLDIKALNSEFWDKAQDVSVRKYWSGVAAPAVRHFTARLLWSDTALYIRFVASQDEPFIVSEKPDLTQKVMGLWDRDVCEIFIAPDKTTRSKYFEFEIAPTGEWVDLGITFASQERKTDTAYKSEMTSVVSIEKEKIVMAIKIPFASLDKTPKTGDVWLGNLFRCVGKDPTRGYLAWQPTKTKTPNFHVPKAFGEFEFVK